MCVKPVLKFILKVKGQNRQNNTKKQSWRTQTAQFQDFVQRCYNQDSVVLGKEHIHRAIELYREPRIQPIQI